MRQREEMARSIVRNGRMDNVTQRIIFSHRSVLCQFHYNRSVSLAFGSWSKATVSARLDRQLQRRQDHFVADINWAALSRHRTRVVTRCVSVSGLLLLREVFACWRQVRLSRVASVCSETLE